MSDREKHMVILEQEFFNCLTRDRCEYGGIGLDDKRPFGDSDVEGSICRLLGMTFEGDDGDEECWSSKQRAYAASLYDDLGPWLQKMYASNPRSWCRFSRP